MPLFSMLQNGFNLPAFLTWFIGLAVGITIHEFAHAWRADKAGDPTPRANGRVSLNPIDHYDPIGSTLILLFGFGWGKPVPTNPFMFRNPRRDEIMVSLWGPLSNLIFAVLLAIPIRLGISGIYTEPLIGIMTLQLVLAVFNLVPIYPLDGSHILPALLPVQTARKVHEFYQRYGMLLLIGFVVFASDIIWPVITGILTLLLVVGT